MRSKAIVARALGAGCALVVGAWAPAGHAAPGAAPPAEGADAAPVDGAGAAVGDTGGSRSADAAAAAASSPDDGGPASAEEGFPPVPPAPPALFPAEPEEAEDETPLVGFQGGRLFIRDAGDVIRLYPGARLRTDFYSTFGPGVGDVTGPYGGSHLKPYLALRRVRFELSGELLQRLRFTLGMDLGGQRIGETTLGGTQARFAPADATDGTVLPAELSISYSYRPWLNFTLGLFNAPFSLSNRTRETSTPLMERTIAIRGFAVPYDKELGLTIWGELDRRVFAWELGAFSGDGPTRPAVDARFDFMGRLYARPFATSGTGVFYEQAQLGVSGRHGERDQEYVDYDYPGIASGQGFVMWLPGYVDSFGRATHVIPSGAQNSIGGELRLPFGLPGGRAIEVRGEAYYVHNETREAVEGYRATHTERFGRVTGVGWYGLLSAWVWGDAFVCGEPGITQPPTVDLERDQPVVRGLEIIGVASGIHANYSGATREGSLADPNTPSADITVYQFGGGLQFWWGWNFRTAINYMAYYTPDSGDAASNQAIVVDNYARDPIGGNAGGSSLFHELSVRLAVSF